MPRKQYKCMLQADQWLEIELVGSLLVMFVENVYLVY